MPDVGPDRRRAERDRPSVPCRSGTLWTHRGAPIPLAVYHGVPEGWRAEEIVAEHERLGGGWELRGPEATEPGAPGWLPERRAWLQYRATLRRVAAGVRAGDAACVELAIRYVELRYIGSYSGYIRAWLARALKHAPLSEGQRARLHAHFCDLHRRREWSGEFGDYFRLWRRIVRRPELERFLDELRAAPGGERRAEWLQARLAVDHRTPDAPARRR